MRDLAARDDEKPFQAGSSSPEQFRFRANRSHPEGEKLLLCISTVRAALADPMNKKSGPPKEKRRKADKKSVRIGKNTTARQAA